MLTIPHEILMKCKPLCGNKWYGELTPSEIVKLHNIGFREENPGERYYKMALRLKKEGRSNPISFTFIWEDAVYERGDTPPWSRS